MCVRFGLRRGETAGLRADALDLDHRRLRVIRIVVEVSGSTAFKHFPKSAAGRRTVPLPDWLTTMICEHIERFGIGDHGLVFPNAVGKPLRRTLFRSRVWRPALVRAGLLGEVAEIDGHQFEGRWTDEDGEAVAQVCGSYDEAVKVVAREAGVGLRFHDLRHSYATWLVDDGVPPNMVQRVMGHENVTTTLQLYTVAPSTTAASSTRSGTLTWTTVPTTGLPVLRPLSSLDEHRVDRPPQPSCPAHHFVPGPS